MSSGKGRTFNLIVSEGQKKNSGRESHQVGPHDGVNQNTGIRKHEALERGREGEGERYGHVSALSCAACKAGITGLLAALFLDGEALSCRLFARPVQTGQITVLRGRAFSLVGSADMLIKVDFAGKWGRAGWQTTPRQKP